MNHLFPNPLSPYEYPAEGSLHRVGWDRSLLQLSADRGSMLYSQTPISKNINLKQILGFNVPVVDTMLALDPQKNLTRLWAAS